MSSLTHDEYASRLSNALECLLSSSAFAKSKDLDESEKRHTLSVSIKTREKEVDRETVEVIESLLHYDREHQQGKRKVDAHLLPSFARKYSSDRHDHHTKLVHWRGDITRLVIGAIVNSASHPYLLGCFQPGHPCIDGAVHAAAGPGLRAECKRLFPNASRAVTAAVAAGAGGIRPGEARLTKAYALPCDHVIHTIGPFAEHVGEDPNGELAACYTESLRLAKSTGIRSLAFCCISTGNFGYQSERAATIALNAVKDWLDVKGNCEAIDLIVFQVYAATDDAVYSLLGPYIFGASQLCILSTTEQKAEDEQQVRDQLDAIRKRENRGRAASNHQMCLSIRQNLHYPYQMGSCDPAWDYFEEDEDEDDGVEEEKGTSDPEEKQRVAKEEADADAENDKRLQEMIEAQLLLEKAKRQKLKADEVARLAEEEEAERVRKEEEERRKAADKALADENARLLAEQQRESELAAERFAMSKAEAEQREYVRNEQHEAERQRLATIEAELARLAEEQRLEHISKAEALALAEKLRREEEEEASQSRANQLALLKEENERLAQLASLREQEHKAQLAQEHRLRMQAIQLEKERLEELEKRRTEDLARAETLAQARILREKQEAEERFAQEAKLRDIEVEKARQESLAALERAKRDYENEMALLASENERLAALAAQRELEQAAKLEEEKLSRIEAERDKHLYALAAAEAAARERLRLEQEAMVLRLTEEKRSVERLERAREESAARLERVKQEHEDQIAKLKEQNERLAAAAALREQEHRLRLEEGERQRLVAIQLQKARQEQLERQLMEDVARTEAEAAALLLREQQEVISKLAEEERRRSLELEKTKHDSQMALEKAARDHENEMAILLAKNERLARQLAEEGKIRIAAIEEEKKLRDHVEKLRLEELVLAQEVLRREQEEAARRLAEQRKIAEDIEAAMQETISAAEKARRDHQNQVFLIQAESEEERQRAEKAMMEERKRAEEKIERTRLATVASLDKATREYHDQLALILAFNDQVAAQRVQEIAKAEAETQKKLTEMEEETKRVTASLDQANREHSERIALLTAESEALAAKKEQEVNKARRDLAASIALLAVGKNALANAHKADLDEEERQFFVAMQELEQKRLEAEAHLRERLRNEQEKRVVAEAELTEKLRREQEEAAKERQRAELIEKTRLETLAYLEKARRDHDAKVFLLKFGNDALAAQTEREHKAALENGERLRTEKAEAELRKNQEENANRIAEERKRAEEAAASLERIRREHAETIALLTAESEALAAQKEAMLEKTMASLDKAKRDKDAAVALLASAKNALTVAHKADLDEEERLFLAAKLELEQNKIATESEMRARLLREREEAANQLALLKVENERISSLAAQRELDLKARLQTLALEAAEREETTKRLLAEENERAILAAIEKARLEALEAVRVENLRKKAAEEAAGKARQEELARFVLCSACAVKVQSCWRRTWCRILFLRKLMAIRREKMALQAHQNKLHRSAQKLQKAWRKHQHNKIAAMLRRRLRTKSLAGLLSDGDDGELPRLYGFSALLNEVILDPATNSSPPQVATDSPTSTRRRSLPYLAKGSPSSVGTPESSGSPAPNQASPHVLPKVVEEDLESEEPVPAITDSRNGEATSSVISASAVALPPPVIAAISERDGDGAKASERSALFVAKPLQVAINQKTPASVLVQAGAGTKAGGGSRVAKKSPLNIHNQKDDGDSSSSDESFFMEGRSPPKRKTSPPSASPRTSETSPIRLGSYSYEEDDSDDKNDEARDYSDSDDSFQSEFSVLSEHDMFGNPAVSASRPRSKKKSKAGSSKESDKNNIVSSPEEDRGGTWVVRDPEKDPPRPPPLKPASSTLQVRGGGGRRESLRLSMPSSTHTGLFSSPPSDHNSLPSRPPSLPPRNKSPIASPVHSSAGTPLRSILINSANPNASAHFSATGSANKELRFAEGTRFGIEEVKTTTVSSRRESVPMMLVGGVVGVWSLLADALSTPEDTTTTTTATAKAAANDDGAGASSSKAQQPRDLNAYSKSKQKQIDFGDPDAVLIPSLFGGSLGTSHSSTEDVVREYQRRRSGSLSVASSATISWVEGDDGGAAGKKHEHPTRGTPISLSDQPFVDPMTPRSTGTITGITSNSWIANLFNVDNESQVEDDEEPEPNLAFEELDEN